MMRQLFAVTLTVIALGMNACGKTEEQAPEKGPIEQMAEEVADEAVRRIQTPIRQARDLQEDSRERLDDMEEQSEE